MKHHEQFQAVGHISPQTLFANSDATISENIDSIGFHGGRMIVVLQIGSMGTGTEKCTMEESDDGSTWSEFMNTTSKDIDGKTGSRPTSTDDDSDVVFDIPLEGDRKRYFRLQYSTTSAFSRNGNTICCTAILLGRKVGEPVTTANSTKRNNSAMYSTKARS